MSGRLRGIRIPASPRAPASGEGGCPPPSAPARRSAASRGGAARAPSRATARAAPPSPRRATTRRAGRGPAVFETLEESGHARLLAWAAREDVARAVCIAVNGAGRPHDIDRIDQRRLRFRFPVTDALLLGQNDDLTFAGPATIAVTRAGDPLPCDLAANPCSRRPGLLACADRLFEPDGTCNATSARIFPHFTALPPPNNYSALCTDPIPPCDPDLARDVRFAIDTSGNMLVPMDWRGVLVDDDAVPVARLLRGSTAIEAFPGRGDPLFLPDPSVLGSFAPNRVRVPPIFDPQIDPTDATTATFFGTADAPETILRIARHDSVVKQCVGGVNADLPCLVAGDCPGGDCGVATCFRDGVATETPCLADADCPGGTHSGERNDTLRERPRPACKNIPGWRSAIRPRG